MFNKNSDLSTLFDGFPRSENNTNSNNNNNNEKKWLRRKQALTQKICSRKGFPYKVINLYYVDFYSYLYTVQFTIIIIIIIII